MKRLLLIALVLCSSLVAADRRSIMRTYKQTATSSLLIDENFEGTGTPAVWLAGDGNVNFDNTSSPLSGAQDLKIDPGGADTYAYFDWTGTSDEIWVTFEFKESDQPTADTLLLYVENATGPDNIKLNVTTTGAFYISNNAGTTLGSSTTDSVSDNTKYFMYLHTAKGTGANGVWDFEFSTGARTGTGNKFISGSNSNVDQPFDYGLFFLVDAHWVGKFVQIDNVKVSNTGWPP